MTTTTAGPVSCRSLIARHPVAAYFAVAYAISWTLWLPRVASVHGWWDVDVPAWWHYLGAAGPVTSAVLISSLTEGRRGVARLLAQYSPSRVRLRWVAFALVHLLVFLIGGLLLTLTVDGSLPSYAEFAHTQNLPAMALPLTLLVHLLTFAVGEETGWRGFALPRLQHSRTASEATNLLFLGWALWHLPTFFENDSFMAMSVFQVVGWCLGLWMGATFLTWLYNSSGGSLITIVVWHALFNQLSASDAGLIVPAVLSMGVIVVAVLALRLAGPEQLTGLSRHAGLRQVLPSP